MNSTTLSKTVFCENGLLHIASQSRLSWTMDHRFNSEDFWIFVNRNGIKHVHNALYYPAYNGLAERFIKSLKQSLKASVNDGRSLC